MARTHKDRHKWKKKERNRTGESDPEKIKLHRERFLAWLEQQAMVKHGGYQLLVFQARLKFVEEERVTELSLHGEKVADIPFLVIDPSACHYAVAAHARDFRVICESEALSKHVQRMKYLHQPCHLMVENGEVRICSAIVDCQYRRWNDETNQPECTLTTPD